jgi:hypothetical protein
MRLYVFLEENPLLTLFFFLKQKGNLALSRAIGDFEFKQNDALPAEKQVVTSRFIYNQEADLFS